ncbi:MAG: hypothetical protein HY812_00020 [Planctomycetes bacterium]|nr:hypothetical protein [Planctomycetota bacterium]
MRRPAARLPILAALALLAPCLTPALAAAQASDGPPIPGASARGFLARHGGNWRVVLDPASGNPAFVYGGRFALAEPPLRLEEFESAARAVVEEESDLLGVTPAELVLEEVRPLALARIGSSDKVAVTFRQEVDGIPVERGQVTVLFERGSGAVLALDSTAVPNARLVDLAPRSMVEEAVAAGSAAFEQRYGLPAARVEDVRAALIGPSAYFGRENALSDRGPTLAYVIELSCPGLLTAEGLPAGAIAYVSAEGDLTVFKLVPTSYAASSGTTAGNVNVGPEPNSSTNQEQPFLKNIWIQDPVSGSILATTGAGGAFSFASSGPARVELRLKGPYAFVESKTGASSLLSGVLDPGIPASYLFNPALSEYTTAEVAAYYWVDRFRDWIKGIDPSDVKMDFSVKANVNLSAHCNAYFTGGIGGGSINFFSAGSGCTNTSYKAVIHHEEGHYANVKYNGAVTGAFHEGAADAWAYYIADDPCLYAFYTSGGCLRHGEQTSVLKCPTDGDESCHGGEVHLEGEALASGLWAVKKNLKAALGASAGAAAADALFLAWLQVFNDGAILNVINDHWIALDDDNGNIYDLTPHFSAINAGFTSYNWPGVVVPDLMIDLVNAPAQNGSVQPLQPVTIEARLVSNFGLLTATELYYSSDGGANFSMTPMLPAGAPDHYTASIPGMAYRTSPRWYVRVTGSLGGSLTEPAGAPQTSAICHCGLFVPLQQCSFDNVFSEEGWTHALLSGTSGDQWERACPAAPGSQEATDPKEQYSGIYVWGTDLSTSGADGKYEPSGSGELRSPAFDLSASPHVKLQYRRWLAVEKASADQASILVNGAQVWQNPAAQNLIDTTWVLHDLDITAQAAGNPAAQIKWRLAANGSTEYGGWNIDDVLVYRIDPPVAGYFAAYGAGCPGSFGKVPALGGSGAPTPGGTVTLAVSNGLLMSSGLLLLATAQGSTPLGGGCDCLLGGTFLGGGIPLTLGFTGEVQLTGPIPAGTPVTDVYLQWIGFDSGSANGQYAVSNGLHMHIE